MTRFHVLPNFISTTIRCPYPDQSQWGTVMVHPTLHLCEVGKDCPAKQCMYRYTDAQVEACPTCGGNPNISTPPYGCSTCDVFGIVRKGTTQA